MGQAVLARRVESLNPQELAALFASVPLLAHLSDQDFGCFKDADRLLLPKGGQLSSEDEQQLFFWILLRGRMSVYKAGNGDRARRFLMEFVSGDTAGEVPLLKGETAVGAYCEAAEDCDIVRLPQEGFWQMMASCPEVRAGVLGNMVRRNEFYQAMTLHREKLISLGTLAAGLMHELNNPGAAARRAASQLRENMTQLQAISLRHTRAQFTPEQLLCLAQLQERAFQAPRQTILDSIEQSDREEELAAWLEEKGVENSWRLAPTLVSAGWDQCDISCAQQEFPPQLLSDTLNYLDALISSVQLVGTIEESIARVTDLVTAVKKYAYDDKRGQQQVDVRDTLMSTLTILGHKFRSKQLQVETLFEPHASTAFCIGSGLAQVWTNLLDNAIDAAPEKSTIAVRLWQEGNSVCVSVLDHGPGIAPEHRAHIFQPFYTTKEVGVGTGLGLDIAHRIVVSNFNGDLSFTSEPGHTEFVVRLPLATHCTPEAKEGGNVPVDGQE